MKGHIFLACELLCFRNRALDAIGDKVKVRLALFHGCSCVRLQDNHRPVRSRAIRKAPPMITAPISLSESPTTSWNCSIALPIHANTSDGSSFLSAINPSSDTERPNMTFPMVFSDLCGCYSTRQLPRNKQYTPRDAKNLLLSC